MVTCMHNYNFLLIGVYATYRVHLHHFPPVFYTDHTIKAYTSQLLILPSWVNYTARHAKISSDCYTNQPALLGTRVGNHQDRIFASFITRSLYQRFR